MNMNKKGFATIPLLFAIAILFGGAVFVNEIINDKIKRAAEKMPARFSYDDRLGASVTPNFPGQLNSFAEGDVIEEEDWDRLERAIGTTTLNVAAGNTTTSLNYRLNNASSSNPGHVHTTSTVTGLTTQVWNIGQGGTATTTFILGLVTASGTDAFGSLAPTSNGQIPIASGTQFVANTLTAGSNITVTNGSGTITLGANTTYATTTSMIPQPAMHPGNATSNMSAINNQVQEIVLYEIPFQISVGKITIFVDAITTSGSRDIAIYPLDGSYQIASTTISMTAVGIASSTFTPVTINPGLYYIGFIENGTTNVTTHFYTRSAIGGSLSVIGSEPKYYIEITGQPAGELVTSFNPITATSADQIGLYLRLDN